MRANREEIGDEDIYPLTSKVDLKKNIVKKTNKQTQPNLPFHSFSFDQPSHLPCGEILPNFARSRFIKALFSPHQQLSLPRFNPKNLSVIRPRTDTKKGAHSAHSHNYRQIRGKSSGNR